MINIRPPTKQEQEMIFWKQWEHETEPERIKRISQLIPIIRQSLVDDQIAPTSSARLLNSYFQDLERTLKIKVVKLGGNKNGSLQRSKKQTKKQKSSIPRPKKRL